jgi:hypothetical protein
MQKITQADIVSNEEYLRERERRRSNIIALRKLRRIEVGPLLSFTFENRETVKYQIQEMLRVEKIGDPSKIQAEIDVYNDLVPEPNSLSTTMFIEIPDQEQVRKVLDRMQGLDRSGAVFLSIDGNKVPAEFEPGHSKEDRISAVHYVKFRLTPDQATKFGGANVELHVEQAEYKAHATFRDEQKKEIAGDLQ